VIVSSRGGASEIVRHEREGIVVDPFDVDALAGTIDRVLADPDLRERLGAAGRTRLQRFDWSRVTAEYVGVYEQSLAGIAA
jgi:glycogen synthase